MQGGTKSQSIGAKAPPGIVTGDGNTIAVSAVSAGNVVAAVDANLMPVYGASFVAGR